MPPLWPPTPLPVEVISGSQTGLSAPVDLALDSNADQLYVADGSSILVFANASTANNNTAPVRSFNLAVDVQAILLDTNDEPAFCSRISGNGIVDALATPACKT